MPKFTNSISPAVHAPSPFLAAIATVALGLAASLSPARAAGEPDPTFGDEGKALVSFQNGLSYARAVTVGAGGEVYLAGHKTVPGTNGVGKDLVVAKLDAYGQPVASFGDNGTVIIDTALVEEAWAVRLDAVGNVYVGGTATVGGSAALVLVKLSPAGVPVDDFGDHGKLILDIGEATNEVLRTILFAPQTGDLLLVGYLAPTGSALISDRRDQRSARRGGEN